MPSPIAHSVIGYAICRIFGRRMSPGISNRFGSVPSLLAFSIGFSLLPDIDSFAGFVAGDFGRFHNNLTHSLFVAAGVALVTGLVAEYLSCGKFTDWFSLAFLCYGMHVLMDAATVGKGVMALWPITDERFMSPIPLFYGFHWSDGWLNRRHWWTATTELAFAGFILLLFRLSQKGIEQSG